MLPGVTAAHDVQIREVHATIPKATWDKRSSTWSVDLAAMILCDANSENVAGVLFLQPAAGDGPLGALSIDGVPGQKFRGTSNGLAPGVYNLIWPSALCYAQPQNGDDQGQHGSDFENQQIRQVELYDCATPEAARGFAPRFTPRPLIPVSKDLPADVPILCPPLPLPDCAGKGARAASVHSAPLIAHRGGPSVEPCAPPGAPDTPAATVDCPPGTHARMAPSPLIPPRGSVPKSSRGNCFGDVKVVVDKPPPAPPCKTRAARDPLVARPCTPKPQGPAEGYAAAIAPAKPLGSLRYRVASGHRETFRMKLSAAAQKTLRKPDTAVRFITTYRAANGRTYTARSAPMAFEP